MSQCDKGGVPRVRQEDREEREVLGQAERGLQKREQDREQACQQYSLR